MNEAAGVALVTGGARRIGKAIVEDLAAHGFAVAIHANRSTAEADALAGRIRAKGGRAAVIVADLTDMDAVGDLVGRSEAALGPVTLLVNNASLFVDDRVEDFDWQAWDRHFAIHVKTPALLAQNFARALPEGAQGLIVNTQKIPNPPDSWKALFDPRYKGEVALEGDEPRKAVD